MKLISFTFSSLLFAASLHAQTGPGPVIGDGDIINFHEVHDYLYRGGRPAASGLVKLQAMGVRTVIDLEDNNLVPGEEVEVKKLGMRFIHLPMSSRRPTDDEIRTLWHAINDAKLAPELGSVFVHCMHGSDRTGSMIGIWRVTSDGFTYADAYKEMLKYYFNPHDTELSQVVRDYVGKTIP